jgi:beta-N-acetylhexosaminidase
LFYFILSFILIFSAKAESDFDQAYEKLSLEERVSQLLFIGYRSVDQLKDIKAGGVALFSWNMSSASDAKKLSDEIKTKVNSAWPPFIATDHEGGRVLRIRSGITPFPDALALGATADPKMAFEVGKLQAQELRALGINTNFAPVLDLGNARSFLQNRVWGNDPEQVSKMTIAYMQGLKDAGVLSVAKHFPGHGGSDVDAHFGRPIIKKSWEDIWRWDLLPFRKIIDAGAPALMTAHAEFESVERGPASSSKVLLTHVLRQTLHYEGLVISDDLEMQAARGLEGLSIGDLALQSLKAGGDMVMVVWSRSDQKKVKLRLMSAVISGELPEYELKQKLKRIWDLKALYKNTESNEKENQWRQQLAKRSSIELVREILKKALKWEAGQENPILKAFSNLKDKAWKVYVPDGRLVGSWNKYRQHDEVSVISKRLNPTDRSHYLNEIKKNIKEGQPMLLITPPRAQGDEPLFLGFLDMVKKLQAKEKNPLPILWLHQGSMPIQVSTRMEKDLKIGVLSLASTSPYSLSAFTEFFREKLKSIE